jgi:hypothetical protein
MTSYAFNEEGNYDYRGNNEDEVGDKRCERIFLSFFFLFFSHYFVLYYHVYSDVAGKQ